MPISHSFDAGAELRVGPLNPPLLESGYTDFDAVWCLTYEGGSPVSLPRNRESSYRRLAAMNERYRRRQTTDRRRQTGLWQYRLIGLQP